MTREEVLLTFEYLDGNLIWKVDSGARKVKGNIAGSMEASGHLSTKWKGKRYKNHRLIYLMHHGDLPEFIDHIDQDPSNNKIENLRPITKSQNMMNSNQSRSKYGKNISWHGGTQRYRVGITKNKKQYVTVHRTLEEARVAVEKMRQELHGDYASGI